ncbi:MAG: phage tail sheath subtilisin-like domain-containing protein [Caldilineaceae bacterium]|nr:phage tail sheath subtilisin-like domain-containing protein [Caldilineaceae bacterium]
MAETFNVAEFVIPGTYIRVRAEGLISAGGISTGNIGIVGTARNTTTPIDYNTTFSFSDYATAQAVLGAYDAYADGAGKLNLVRALEVLFNNGARTVYARALDLVGANDDPPDQAAYTAAFNELVKDDVNILIAPELATATALTVLGPIIENAENNSKDLMAVAGSDAATVAAITAQVSANDRFIVCAPGVHAFDSAAKAEVDLNGRYTAAAVAGLLSTLSPQSSPTNKQLAGVTKLAQRFSYSDLKDLINGGVLVLEERLGVRVVRGVTTEMASNGPFKQVTTRRIVDFGKAGIRQVSNPFIGRLNNQRVRKALQGAIDGFLTTMVQDEALTEYALEVTATRDDEIAGRAIVNAILKPTFSIDFIAVTLTLQ